jgi:NAD(P)-dependent dehydrogenase (short-subunit alcohol dehydrogenase family)
MPKQPWTAADVPSQQGRTAVITGANTGLGLETAKVLAAKGASVVLAVRNLDKGQAAADQITAASRSADVTVHQLDLTSLDAIRKSADALRARLSAIDLLINNAGVMYTPKQQTADGFELQFGTNHLGHFAFTGLLLDMLLPVPDSRVITVSSIGHRIRAKINFDDLQSERSYSRIAAYGQSKLANLMFTYELQRRLSGKGKTIAAAAHPGGSNTELMRNMPAVLRVLSAAIAPLLTQSAAAGALPTLRAATDPNVLGGQYYGPSGLGEARGNPVLVKSSEQSHDVEIQRRLWTVSEELTGVKFPV